MILEMPEFDSIDEQLIQLLEKNADQSSAALARQLQTSSATVRRRVRKLMKSGAFRTVGLINPSLLGLTLVAVMVFNVKRDEVKKVVAQLVSNQEIRWVASTTGRYDIVCVARFRSTDHLSEFLNNEISTLPGLRHVETLISLQVAKCRLDL